MKLSVKPMTAEEVDSRAAVLDHETLDELDVDDGGYVAIDAGDGDRVVTRARADRIDIGDSIVRIGARLRREIGVNVDDRVTVERADVRSAEQVTIALPFDIDARGDLGLYVRDQLVDRVVTAGQTVTVEPGFGSSSKRSARWLPVSVVETEPTEAVVVEEWTSITVSESPAEGLTVDDVPDRGTPAVTYEDVGGLDDELERVRELIKLPMHHPELFEILGVEPPRGVLLYGPSGTGKTLVSRAVIDELDVHVRTLSGPEIFSGSYGEEDPLGAAFEAAERDEPALLFIDEIDAITSDRDAGGDLERRVTARLLSLMDDASERLTVLATTDRVNELDPALRRPGRFDREIEIGVPDEEGREEILAIHTRGVALADDVEIERYAEHTHGFVGADLEDLVRESAMHAARRVRSALDVDSGDVDAGSLESIRVTDADFREALRGTEPSALRELFVEVPDVSWADVGGFEDVKERLRETVQWPLEHPDAFERVDLRPAKGVLLYGPPGTGKTLLAKAVANEAQSNFISIKGPELFDKYVGESEKGVREVFSKARENAPTIVFFDEIDSIATERGREEGGTNVGERVVSQLLTELDGLEELEDVVVIATTNRPNLVDSALLRPGRLDRHVPISVPDEDARREILAIHTREKPLADDVSLDALVERTDGFVGADLEALCREAAAAAVREYVREMRETTVDADTIELTVDHFDRALDEVELSRTNRRRFD
ncbi:AAA family ATPase [Halalkalicoccus sp. GCM10025322]|uniref:AAA family ATPase n=1 Tax=Halalkalicoccus TaxID=332246 RepID=UPI002F96DF7E